MIGSAAFALIVSLAQVAPEATPAEPAVEPHPGTLAEGRAKLQATPIPESSEALDELVALERSLEAAAERSIEPERERAAALYDVGVSRGTNGDFEGAARALFAARGLAGSSALGLDAVYDAGTFLLQRAEQVRVLVPEVRTKLGLPPLPEPAAPAAPGLPQADSHGPDPVALAREAYLRARAPLVDRLRSGWRDADTRANLELVARRLRELEQIEREREEQQKQDEQQKQEQGDQGEPSNEKKPSEDEGQPKPDENAERDPSQEPPETPQEEPEKPPEEEPAPEEAEAQPEDERVLSKEEVLRLLDQLREIEEQAEAVRAKLRARSRPPVKRDW